MTAISPTEASKQKRNCLSREGYHSLALWLKKNIPSKKIPSDVTWVSVAEKASKELNLPVRDHHVRRTCNFGDVGIVREETTVGTPESINTEKLARYVVYLERRLAKIENFLKKTFPTEFTSVSIDS